MAEMSAVQAVVLGLVEGITEFLPISSTGHLILASAVMGLDTPEAKRAIDAFNIVIQGGAILAVAGLYWPRVVQMLRGLVGRDNAGTSLLLNLMVAFVPAAVLGLALDKVIEAKLFSTWPVLFALAGGGVYMMWLDLRRRGRMAMTPYAAKTIDDLTPRDALMIGLMQCVAMWPGTSRSMMTITGGVLRGLSPKAAAEFSFLLGLPTLGAACLYKLATNHGEIKALGSTNVVLGVVVAAVTAAVAIKWLVGFLSRHGMIAFGIYRIVLAAVLCGLVLAGALKIAR